LYFVSITSLSKLIDENIFTIYSLSHIKIGSNIVNKIIETLETIDKIEKNEFQKRMNALYLFFVLDPDFDLVIIIRALFVC